MKQSLTISGTILLASLIIFSCGDKNTKKESETETPATAPTEQPKEDVKPAPISTIPYSEFKIGNQDKALFKMVEGGSTEIRIDERGFINVIAEFEVVKTFTGKAKFDQAFVSLIALDSENTPIALSSTTNGEMRSSDSEGKQFFDFLLGEPGSKIKMEFSGSVSKEGTFDPDVEKTTEAAKNIAKYKVLTTK